MSRILFVAIYYWPEISGNAPYTSLLAEHLAERGHDVTVLTGMPHYPEGRTHQRYRGHLGWSEEHRGVEVRRRAHYVPGRQTALRRAAYEASFLLTGSFFRARPRPDIIVGVSPSLSSAALAAEYAIRTGRPFCLILQDLMGRAAEQSGIPGGRSIARATAAAEGWIARRANYVGVVAPDFVPYLLEHGVRSDRIAHLPNWTHISEPLGDRAATRRRLGWGDHETIVLHAGNMGLKQGLEQVVEAARNAPDDPAGLRFVLMGDGNQRSELERRAAGLSNVDFRPFEPPETFPDTLAAADILLLSERPSVRDMSLPSKVTSYLAAGRPIIAAVAAHGATAGLVARSGAAILAEAGDPQGILRAIASIQTDPVAGERLGRAGQLFAAKELSSEDGLARSAEFVEQIEAGRSPGTSTARDRSGRPGNSAPMKVASRLRVGIAQPIRLYLRHTPINRGRGFMSRQILRRVLPPAPACFVLPRPGASRVTLYYREELGLSAFVRGGFEDAECRLLVAMTTPGSTAIDVGANVGIHAIPMAASSPSARVLAIEPLPSNARRLRENAEANSIRNIEVIEAAVGSDEGVVTLHVADDPAYASTDAVLQGHHEIGQLTVEQTTLDAIWESLGRPFVSLIKIDVEGGEIAVLAGAQSLLVSQHPSILIEAHEAQLGVVRSVLARNGYRSQRMDDLLPWNHIFRATERLG